VTITHSPVLSADQSPALTLNDAERCDGQVSLPLRRDPSLCLAPLWAGPDKINWQSEGGSESRCGASLFAAFLTPCQLCLFYVP
jgi:hypothetical protein